MDIEMEKRPDAFRGDLGLLLGSFTRPLQINPHYYETILTDGADEFDIVTNGAIRRDATPGWHQICGEILYFYELYEPDKQDWEFEAMSRPKSSSKRYNRTLLVNLGPHDAGCIKEEGIDDKLENIRWSIRRGVVAVCRLTTKKLYIDPCGFPKIVGESAIYGMFERNEMNKNIPLIFKDQTLTESPVEIILHDTKHSAETLQAFEEGMLIGYCENFARALHGPVFFMIIDLFIKHIREKFDTLANIEIIVREENWIEENKMESFLQVSNMNQQQNTKGWTYKTTYTAPKMLEIHYTGGLKSLKPIVLNGKAMFYEKCTFTKKFLLELKPFCLNDVSAGACIAAVILAATRLNLPLNLIGIIPLCSRSPHPVPDFTMHVKIPNTLEERLLLQATLTYSHDFDPSLIVTIATKAGYLRDAFEFTTSALYTDDHVAKLFLDVCSRSGERFIQLPFLGSEDETLFDNIVEEQDYCSITASYLKKYALTSRWIHLDMNNKSIFQTENVTEPYKMYHVTGAPTRTLIEFCQLYAEKESLV